MKKITAVFLTVAVVCGLTACGGSGSGKEAVAPFMEEHPDITVEIVAATDFVAMNQNAIASHQANDDYDVMFVNHVDTLAMCNDDQSDNRFYDPIGRIPKIEEDEPPYRLLCNEYPQ